MLLSCSFPTHAGMANSRAAGIGEIQEQVVRGGHERFQLVAVTH
jgi:hypothetical protein